MDIPEKPSTPEPTREATPGAYLPPKLREKLEAADEGGGDWEPKGSSPLPWIIVALVVLGGGTWGFMAVRANAAKRKAAEEARVAQVRADSIAAAARADSLRALMQDTTATAAPGTTGSTTAAGSAASRTTAGGASSAGRGSSGSGQGTATAPASTGGPYGLAVATYLFEDRAQSEKERLATATGLQARVVTRTEGGTTVYRLILGSFDSRSAAERKAEELTGQNVVSQASVVPLR